MDTIYRWWKSIPVAVRKPLVFMIGFAIVVAGIAMLALPGPGWAAIFLGFAVLTTEFAFAEKVRDWLITQLHRVLDPLEDWWAKKRGKTPPHASKKAAAETTQKTAPKHTESHRN